MLRSCILLMCFAYTLPRWADPNQNSRLDMVFAIVDDHTFQIDSYVTNTVDYARVGEPHVQRQGARHRLPGRSHLCRRAPGAGSSGRPVRSRHGWPRTPRSSSTLRPEGTGVLESKVRFAIVQVLLAFALAAVPSACSASACTAGWRTSPRTPACDWRPWRGYGLLSPAFAYANALYGHQLAAALLFGAFLLAYGGKGGMRAGRLAAIGVLLAASVLTEYPAAIVAGVIGVYTWAHSHSARQGRAIGWVVVGAAPLVAGWMAYNTVVFGAPWSLGYSYSTLWTAEHQVGFMSLTVPSLESIWGITFSAFRGLFLLSPLLLLSVAGFPRMVAVGSAARRMVAGCCRQSGHDLAQRLVRDVVGRLCRRTPLPPSGPAVSRVGPGIRPAGLGVAGQLFRWAAFGAGVVVTSRHLGP